MSFILLGEKFFKKYTVKQICTHNKKNNFLFIGNVTF